MNAAPRVFVVVLSALCAGSGPAGVQEPPSLAHRYDFEHRRQRFDLPGRLDEVSGLAFDAAGTLLAHDDERGTVYRIDPDEGSVDRGFRLGDTRIRDDFEGIAVAGERIFMVSSRGLLYELRAAPERTDTPVRVTDTHLGRTCEVEGLAYRAEGDELLLACKTLPPGSAEIRVHRLPLDPDVSAPPPIRASFARLVPFGLDRGFHPSGLDVDPATGRIVLVAAVEEALVELEPDGTVVSVVKLSRSRHPQPEGIAFGPDGLLYVADEANGRDARLSVYGPPEPRARP